MKERPLGEVLTDTNHIGEYIAVRSRVSDAGERVGKMIESDTDLYVVQGCIRREIREYRGKGVDFTYFLYKPSKPGEDREGWIIGQVK